ncbi:MAG TPA: DUF2330 domain-containing protein [Acidimicrobiales bacterium]|nr:DUF2330 domain-containing protein [Acidimicrobiales bacterium]
MRRFLLTLTLAGVVVGLAAGPAGACGGLIGRNGAVNLLKTTTLAAYTGGVEHYVTSFEFAGAGGEFGSIVPLPGVPASVERGGDWTLQRLVREVRPPVSVLAATARANSGAVADEAQVLLEKRIDALDLTVLRGGAQAVGRWAADHGFLLPPDAPEVLDFYASRSPIFLAARFDADAARQRGVAIGDGTPIHLAIPTDNPWVPLRILALGRQPAERVNADVFLLTDRRPTLLPGEGAAGLRLQSQGPASSSLLDDLRSDKGMAWVPQSSWLTYLQVDAAPSELTYDLAVDASGTGQPSRLAAGLEGVPVAAPRPPADAGGAGSAWPLAAAVGAGVAVLAAAAVAVAAGRGRRPA